MGCKNYGPLPVHVHIAIATEVIQLPCSGQQAFFINVEVWLVTLTDESALASNRKHVMYDFVFCCGEVNSNVHIASLCIAHM